MYAITINSNDTTSWRAIGSLSDLLPNETFSDSAPEPSLADAAAEIMADVQSWLDWTARQNGYDSLASCISYKDSSIGQWSSDATVAITWRDAVWQACFQWQQSSMIDQPMSFPSSSDVISLLPQPEAFGWVRHLPGQE